MGSGPSTYKRRRTKFSISCGKRQPLEVNFDDFQILRAIGKGSFGKVCIVQKKDTMKMYAMKYMNKIQCIEKDAFKNVLKEIEILCSLEHPFIVNLWFTFQDEEDMFMVVDLLLGGDLRYHLQQSNSHFSEERVALYICEIALALDYLRSKRIIHRDIKPDNILLDDCGHAHLTDFNVAIVVKEGEVANSVTGTKPYMAPEVTMCSRDLSLGYSYAADWWSLGITAYELLCRKRPYDIRSDTSMEDIQEMILNTCLRLPQSFDQEFTRLINEMLCPDPEKRISSVDQLRAHCYLRSTDFTAVLNGQVTPSFVPNKKQLNCDPTFELEEMIIEAKPLHKKKKRLSKRNRTRTSLAPEDSEVLQMHLNSIQEKFTIYNRERELQKRAMEAKEKDWEEEMKKVIS